tara:strand:+ start:138 stop:344 length:207 start_codon:yes stop_codon:yes gene_type:complete
MTEENLIVDVEAQEVIDEPAQPEQPEQPKMSYQERKSLERSRATTLNKMLKNYRRQQKNPLTIAKKLG